MSLGVNRPFLRERRDVNVRNRNYPGPKSKSEITALKDSNSNFAGEHTDVAEITVRPTGMSDSEKWKLGGCPRCQGDVFLDSEDGELLGHCLQCGFVGARVVKPAARFNPDD